MNRSQLQDTLGGGAFIVGRPRKPPGFAAFWRAAEPHLWCAACTRTFPNGLHRLVGGLEICPYADCVGDLAADAHDWNEIKRHHPNYPVTPWMAVQYRCQALPARPIARPVA